MQCAVVPHLEDNPLRGWWVVLLDLLGWVGGPPPLALSSSLATPTPQGALQALRLHRRRDVLPEQGLHLQSGWGAGKGAGNGDGVLNILMLRYKYEHV